MDNAFSDDELPAPTEDEIAREGWILLRIHVPELDINKCLQFPVDKLVWDIKQQVIASLPKELKEAWNYGLFAPPSNGKAGKFLDEERRLGDYSFSGPVGYLELKYKRRVYKMLNLDERQLRALHSRSNLRRFLEYVNGGHVEKVSKMCAKGLDPNFHDAESGETPLAIAAIAKKPQKLLIALVNGGALLDYRTKDGSTALHRAVEKDCFEAVSTLMELGASPNYKDSKLLTPVYLSVAKRTDAKITELLLHDHAVLGIQDTQGWNEVHQACRNGLVQHLEHLLMYGADMNSKNSTGNTPLHVCAVNNQETCARILLFRGSNREALNYANQTPYQVAVIASNFELADMIQNFRIDNIVPIREPPRYNPRRRSGIGCWINGYHTESLASSSSVSSSNTLSWNNQNYHNFARLISNNNGACPSPCPSDQPFNSASSSLSESSSSHRSQEDDISYVTDKSLGDTSDTSSSGVGTNSESNTCSIGHPNTTVVCIEKYEAQQYGHISIQPGDVIEVIGSTDCGMLEGYIRGTSTTGLFPSQCTQEVQFRQKNFNATTNHTKTVVVDYIVDTTSSDQQQQFIINSEQTAVKKSFSMPQARTVLLQRAKRGFGFVLRGAKSASPLMQLKPSMRCPALQYLDDVDPGGVADLAGLNKGDFLLSINGEDVTCASHEYVVELIRNSSNAVSLTVVTVAGNENINNNNAINNNYSTMNSSTTRQFSTLPRRLSTGANKAPAPPRRDPKTTLSVGRARARSMVAGLEGNGNDDDLDGGLTKASSIESIHQQHQTSSMMSTPIPQGTPVQQPRTASIKSRPTSIGRITAAELEDLFQRQQGVDSNNRFLSMMMTTSRFQSGGESSLTPQPSPSKGPVVYASMAEMKRKKTKNMGRAVAIPSVASDLKRSFHSSPDLPNAFSLSGSATWTTASLARKGHLSQDDVQNIHYSIQRLNLPPPNHAPPAPPTATSNQLSQVGQVVKVDVSRKSEYESTAAIQKKIQQKAAAAANQELVSSFKPTNAKMYATPQDLNIINNNNIHANSASSSTFRIYQASSVLSSSVTNEQNVTKINLTAASGNLNPYAQPGRIGIEPQLFSNENSPMSPLPPPPPPPPIPEPDYSSNDEDDEEEHDDNSVKQVISTVPFSNENANTMKRNDLKAKDEQIVAETSGNSNTSSSSNSNAMPHSFSVDEIKKIRTNLKSSKSLSNVEGDNSSSGVSSDQEIINNASVINNASLPMKNIKALPVKMEEKKKTATTIISTEDAASDEDSPPLAEFQRNNSLTRKQAAIIAANRAKALAALNQNQVVSLTQLPPPIEADSDDEDENNEKMIFAPPPPEFSDIVSSTRSLHIPTQQYHHHHHEQNHQHKSVRIVGALPKQQQMQQQQQLLQQQQQMQIQQQQNGSNSVVPSVGGKIVRGNHQHHHVHYHHGHHQHH